MPLCHDIILYVNVCKMLSRQCSKHECRVLILSLHDIHKLCIKISQKKVGLFMTGLYKNLLGDIRHYMYSDFVFILQKEVVLTQFKIITVILIFFKKK